MERESFPPRIVWERGDDEFVRSHYSRAHTWTFDGGAVVPASSSPGVVRPPLSDPAGVDPEEALSASLASCHMLWFLAIASRKGFIVDRYVDTPEPVLGRNEQGKTAVLSIALQPVATFSGAKQPAGAEVTAMHDEAHERCFIANTLRAEVIVRPVISGSDG